MENFCKKHNLTVEQFLGAEKIKDPLDLRNLTSIPDGFNPTVGGSLNLGSLTSIPDGFNPTVGGYLDLRNLTSIPDGFNPTVGGYLYLESLTSIPEGFNPTVGGYLDLRNLTSIPEGFNPTVGGPLDLRNLTSIPEGFNPTVGSYLDLESLTSIPEGFNPTVGSYLYLRNLTSIFIKFENQILSWENGKYILCDGIFTEVLSKKKGAFFVKKIGSKEKFYIATDGKNIHAHGNTLKKATEDLQFKLISEKLKNEPINKDTIITINYYRLITGACELGVKSWIEQNNISQEEFKASELLPILEKTKAYGVERFKKLITF